MADDFNPMHCNSVHMLVIGDHPLTDYGYGVPDMADGYVRTKLSTLCFFQSWAFLISAAVVMQCVWVTSHLVYLFHRNYQILMPFCVISPEIHRGICMIIVV